MFSQKPLGQSPICHHQHSIISQQTITTIHHLLPLLLYWQMLKTRTSYDNIKTFRSKSLQNLTHISKYKLRFWIIFSR